MSDATDWQPARYQERVGFVTDGARFFERVAQHARAQLYREGVWWIDYVRLRVEAVKQDGDRRA